MNAMRIMSRKSHLKAVMEASITGIEFVGNYYDNQFFSADFLAKFQSVCFIIFHCHIHLWIAIF